MRRLVFDFIILSCLVQPSMGHASLDICRGLLGGFNKQAEPAPRTSSIDGTSGFIAYLGQLLEQQLIGNDELQKLTHGIETRGEISNPIPHEMTQYGIVFTKGAYQIHYQALQEYIQHAHLDQQKVLAWARGASTEKERVRERREETRSETQDIHQKMEFHRVEKGDFLMGEGSNKAKVTLTHAFEAMSTAVTQKMWTDKMGDNPSKFQDGEHTILVSKNGKSIKMQPDNPVENITWWSAVVFANQVSTAMNFTPAYDLSQITDWEGSAESGTLKPRDEGRAKALLKINSPNDNIYEAQGYRLPTEAEQEYLLTDRGRSPGKYFSGVTESNLQDHAWYNENSKTQAYPNGTTHPVGQFLPQNIDGKDFDGLLGNVWEWGHDQWDGNAALKGGIDPVSKAGPIRVVRGGSWFSLAVGLRSAYRSIGDPGVRSGNVGLRLVRTVP